MKLALFSLEAAAQSYRAWTLAFPVPVLPISRVPLVRPDEAVRVQVLVEMMEPRFLLRFTVQRFRQRHDKLQRAHGALPRLRPGRVMRFTRLAVAWPRA